MERLSYARLNNLLGCFVGLIALVVYAVTVEPTASYWDCGEFIAVSNKLEVPHPPGAPLYLMIGRMFSLLARGDVEQIAYWVNMLSVLASALTITFLFWTITLLARRLCDNSKVGVVSGNALYGIMGAGCLGALIFTFSDSFWFSAVEAEVYGVSSLFTAIIVWAIIRWANIKEDSPRQWQWLIMISYLIGLSIGVHLLGLLALPTLTLLIYYKKYKHRVTNFGSFLAASAGLVIVGIIMLGIIQGLPSIAAGFDITFVNQLGLPFYSGIIVFLLLLFGSITMGIIWTHRKKMPLLNTLLLSLAFVLVGYSSYMLVLIRSLDNPPIDENNPEDVLNFISYLKREQYGDRTLIYGEHFASRLVDQKKSTPVYKKGEKEYEIIDWQIKYVYEDRDKMFFPRIYSSRHASEYRAFLGLSEKAKPRGSDNLRFLFGYQIGYMYLRYLMWNFVGRSSDEQGADWLSPLDVFSESSLPFTIQNNKGRNNYWGLPFLLGLVGLIFQGWRDERGLRFVSLLFLLMGLGLVLYLNMPPSEPRERDYIYTGSYYAFSIWIGMSFMAMMHGATRIFKQAKIRLISCGILALVPIVLMAKENWDDHDRSGRYFSVDSARNLLESCEPHSILFTGGDNDTFPLWYAQEVEGIRTDVRVVVLSYFNTDWYISQMMRPAYESSPLPFTLDLAHYAQGGVNDLLYISPRKDISSAISLDAYLELVRNFDSRIQVTASTGSHYNMIPAQDVVLEIDQKKVESMHIPQAFDSLRTDVLYIRLEGKYLEKKDLAILDLIAAQEWSRPIYFNHTSLRGIGMNLEPYVVQEGLAYRLLPVFNHGNNVDTELMQDGILLDTERMYENVMHKFRFRGLQDEDVYLSEDYRNFVTNHRSTLSALAARLYREGDTLRAREVIHYSIEKMPDRTVPYDEFNLPTIVTALAIGEEEIALPLLDSITSRCEEQLAFGITGSAARRCRASIFKAAGLLIEQGDTTRAKRYADILRKGPQL